MKGISTKLILPATLCALLAVACVPGLAIAGVQNWVANDQGVDPIQGLWSSQVTITNCATGAVTHTFSALNLFSRGGTVLDADNQPSVSHGPGFGVWASSGNLQYVSSFEFYRYNADGTFAGTQQISRAITMAPDEQSFTSKISVAVLDASGNQIGSACGTETATHPTQPPAPPQF